jgi:hypothetical protein
MTTIISLEVGENENQSQCHCCGRAGSTGHGFIYRDGSAYAIYYVAWSSAHPDRGVSFAVAIGEWDEGTTAMDRTCAGIEAYEGQAKIFFRFIGPDASPWANTELLGPILDRQAALKHPLKSEFLRLCEMVVRNHPAVREFLRVQEE